MGSFKKKTKITKDEIIVNEIGQESHVLDGDNGPMIIKELDPTIWLHTGKQWCPDCHKELTHKDGYWECDECLYSITDEECEYGDGYPTLESTYENDYEEYFKNHQD